MDTKEKIALALQALDEHEGDFDLKVPKRLRDFWQSGEAFRYDRKCMMGGYNIPGWGDARSTFRLVAAVPSWEVQGNSAGLDDGVVGPEGDWESARRFVPLFHVESSRYVVACLDKEGCPVGWFDEECWQETGKGYDEGVFLLAPTLDTFLAALGDLKEADFETESYEFVWEEAAGEEGDDEDDDDDD